MAEHASPVQTPEEYVEAVRQRNPSIADVMAAALEYRTRAELQGDVEELRSEIERLNRQLGAETGGRFKLGDRVRKIKGSSWQGKVVGFYSTALTPVGYCVESEREPGSVQIYPEAALELVSNGGSDG